MRDKRTPKDVCWEASLTIAEKESWGNLAFYFAYSDVFVSFLHTVFCHPRPLFTSFPKKLKKKAKIF